MIKRITLTVVFVIVAFALTAYSVGESTDASYISVEVIEPIVQSVSSTPAPISTDDLDLEWIEGEEYLSVYLENRGIYGLSLIHISEPTRPY